MSTFNGWEIVTAPAGPAPRSIEWEFDDVTAQNRNPFSLQKQIYVWNAGILRASVSMPPMNNAQALPWLAFLASLQGIANIFQFGDPLNTGPQNPSATAGTVSGGNQTGNTLITTSSGLLPGDWFQIGLRLYRVTSASGGTLGLWPQIRESPADGSDLVITNTQGIFRLAKNSRKVSVNAEHVYGITFEIEEAI